MADTKISDLAAVTDVLTTDEFVLARSGATKKITGANLASEIGSGGLLQLLDQIVVPAGGSATVAFSSIPGTSDHLVIEFQAQTENASAQNFFLQFNGDSGSNYGWAQGDVVAGGTNSDTSDPSALCGVLAATGDTYPTVGRIEIPFYSGTTWKKVFRAFNNGFYSAANRFNLIQGVWNNTAAITAISMAAASDVKQASVFNLYGY